MSNARFSILQARAVKDKKISDAQFRTLAALGMYADEDGWCFPSLQTLGSDLGKSKQAVGRDTIALRKLGYLEVTNRYDSKNKARHSNLYRLKFDLPRQPDVDTPSTKLVDTPSTSDVDVNVLLNEPINSMPIEWQIAHGAKKIIIPKDNKDDEVETLLSQLDREFHTSFARTPKSQSVARFILGQIKKGESLDRFMAWAKRDDFNASRLYEYAEQPDKIRTRWAQAFVEKENTYTGGKKSHAL